MKILTAEIRVRNINDVPELYVNGERITGIAKIKFEWNTDSNDLTDVKTLFIEYLDKATMARNTVSTSNF